MTLVAPTRTPSPGWYDEVARYPVTTSTPRRHEFDPGVRDRAAAVLCAGPRAAFHALISDQESERAAYVARRVVGAAFRREPGPPPSDAVAFLAAERVALGRTLDRLGGLTGPARTGMLHERAPLARLGDCWLDTVSQAATQPAPIVNLLHEQHFAHRGRGNPAADQPRRRRRALEDRGVTLPHVAAPDFLERAGVHDLTAWHGAFALALGRLPVGHLPELLGVHCARHLLGVDDRLLGTRSAVADADVVALLGEGLAVGGGWAVRVHTGVDLAVAMEREHVALLAAVAERLAGMSLDAQVVTIIARHAPYAGRQHGAVRVGGGLLTSSLAPENFDAVAFMRTLRSSRQLRPMRDGDTRFLRAIRFGGPMFGIFDEAEADVFARWTEHVQAGAEPDPHPLPDPVPPSGADRWRDGMAVEPADVVFAPAPPRPDDRELLHRLVAIERYPNTIAVAREHADRVLAAAEVLFEHGGAGRYTDATYFDYSPEALLARVDDVYWRKLVDPHRPLATIPDAASVVFGQTTFALGSLIDGSWAHRIGAVGRCDERSDQMLLAIYADEMGRGDVAKNHITLIYRALHSMGIELPHIADPAFREQAELPDSLYGFSLFQLSLALFPDSCHDEILGYNLGIEMFGLGEMRLHEMQKLRHHGFDPCYEEAHLSIDNVSAGHARQSAEIVIAHLDAAHRLAGPDAVDSAWRRVWRGYASFAYFVEHQLVRSVTAAQADREELMI
ncbi:MAG: iron-containing redox enzyme family protein [Frankiaceae bacterium]|nr:iron-containing redox enzyme family protein [Frankiaceae bacterium]